MADPTQNRFDPVPIQMQECSFKNQRKHFRFVFADERRRCSSRLHDFTIKMADAIETEVFTWFFFQSFCGSVSRSATQLWFPPMQIKIQSTPRSADLRCTDLGSAIITDYVKKVHVVSSFNLIIEKGNFVT